MDARIDIITAGLLDAFGQPGCPVCRLRHETERRYLYGLLYESITDSLVRARLTRTRGFCPEHAWAFQSIEQQNWGDGMGTAILYEDLTRQVLAAMQGYLDGCDGAQAASTGQQSRRDRTCHWLERHGPLGRRLASMVAAVSAVGSLAESLSALERCPACATGDQSEGTDLEWLVRNLQEERFRQAYAMSDGLCLPHLRGALRRTHDDRSARILVEMTAAKQRRLLADVSEYVRTFSWQYRQEAKQPREQASWIRAVAFFAGEADGWGDDEIDKQRRAALEICRTRPTDGSPPGL